MDLNFVNNIHSPAPTGLNKLHWPEKLSMKMLRYFYVVSYSQSLTQAAEKLHISKSPLSTQMRDLEDILEVELFNRDQRNIQLTSTGILLRDECELIFKQLDQSISKVTHHARQHYGHIRLGIVSSVFWAGFGYASQQLRLQYPEIQFEFIELSPRHQKQALLNNEIDIGIVRYADTINIKPLQACNLYCESMAVAVPKNHHLSQQKSINLLELIHEDFVMLSKQNSASTDFVVQHCLIEGFNPNIIQEVIEPMTLMNIVDHGDALAIVPQSFNHWHWQNVQVIALLQSISANICAVYDPLKINNEKQALIQSLHFYMNQQRE